MRRLLFTTATLLSGCNACLAQVSTMGTTAMGLPSTPGTIVTSPLNGPSPFSATTQPGAPDTTLAPVPLASDPTTPGTVVTCSTPTGQIAPGTPAVPVTSMSAMAGTTGTTPSMSAAPTISAVPATSSTSHNCGHGHASDAVRTTSYVVHVRFSRLDHTGAAAARSTSSAVAFHYRNARTDAVDGTEHGLHIHAGSTAMTHRPRRCHRPR